MVNSVTLSVGRIPRVSGIPLGGGVVVVVSVGRITGVIHHALFWVIRRVGKKVLRW